MALPLQKAELERIITSQEFEQLPEFDERFELVNGELVEKKMPGYEHGLIIDVIKFALYQFDPERKYGTMLAEVSTILNRLNTPVPDASFWTAEHRPGRIKGAAPMPDIAIEVWSPGNLDTQKHRQEALDKVRRYQQAGVPIVWAINPATRQVQVYHPDQDGPVEDLDENGILKGENILPGFELPVRNLFD